MKRAETSLGTAPTARRGRSAHLLASFRGRVAPVLSGTPVALVPTARHRRAKGTTDAKEQGTQKEPTSADRRHRSGGTEPPRRSSHASRERDRSWHRKDVRR